MCVCHVAVSRSAGLSITGSRGRPEPPEPAAARLAAMASRLPGVHGSRQSEGSGTGAAGAVVALVEPESVEVCAQCTVPHCVIHSVIISSTQRDIGSLHYISTYFLFLLVYTNSYLRGEMRRVSPYT